MPDLTGRVREHYRRRALQMLEHRADSCCDTGCGCAEAYTAEDLASAGLDAGVSLGCGNPLLLADLHPGEIVLDLGSGGGLDVLLSARRVSPGGLAYGLDMTDEMLELAERNRRRANIENARFLRGAIENIPLSDRSVDVVISNCVINLAADKGRVLAEAFRVLRPGGRLAVADTVALRPLPESLRKSLARWSACAAGALEPAQYADLLCAAGFAEVGIEVHDRRGVAGLPGVIGSAYIRARRPAG